MRHILLTAGLYAIIFQQALASEVTLGWNASPDPNLAYYNLYYGVASQVYTNKSPVGTNTTDTISELVPGTTYYFAATTVDTSGLESGYSSEVSYLVSAGQLLPCTVTLGNLTQIYTGQAAAVSVSTDPSNLPVTVVYNGSPAAPTNAGSYTVIATVVSSNYAGAATNVLTIAPAPATITLINLVQTYNGAARTVAIATVPTNLAAMVSYNGSTNAPVNAGTYTVVASSMNTNYTGSATNALIIGKAPASIALSGLIQTYNGKPKKVTVTTTPRNLVCTSTYNGSSAAPSAPGSYTVIAAIVNSNYMGSATNTLRIGKAIWNSPSSSAEALAGPNAGVMVQLSGLIQARTGKPCPVAVATVPAGLPVAVTYNGSNQAPSDIGSYTVVAEVGDTNYAETVTSVLTIVGVSPPSHLVIVSWNSALSGVTLLESSNLLDWQTNTTPANVWTASSDSTGTTGAALAVQPGCRFFRAVTNGAAIPFAIHQ